MIRTVTSLLLTGLFAGLPGVFCMGDSQVHARPGLRSTGVPVQEEASATAQADVQWKFQKGQVFQFDIRETTRVAIMVAENNDTDNKTDEIHLQLQLTVLDVQDSIATLQMMYTQMDCTSEREDGGRASASTNPDVPSVGTGPVAKLVKSMVANLKPLLQKPVILEVNPSGKILSLKIDPEIVQQILQEPNTIALRKNLSRESIEKMFGQFLGPFPADNPQQWKTETTIQVSDVPCTTTTVYTRQPAKDSMVPIQFRTNLTFPVEKLSAPQNPGELSDPSLKDQPAPFNFDPTAAKWPRISKQDASGTIYFDTQAGHVSRAEMRNIVQTEKAQSNFLQKLTVDSTINLTVQQRR